MRRIAAVVLALGAAATAAVAEEPQPPRDVDAWHEAFSAAAGGPITEPADRGWSLGLYPAAGLAVGPPGWVAVQGQAFVSLSDGRSFSLFAGFGYERAPESESYLATLGWGGVRRLPAARPQRGFYGKFLRYRRIEDDHHGVHEGLSVGTEHAVGAYGLGFEFGVARSDRDHWAVTVQVALRIGCPLIIGS
ncbi:MAG: hypothetical protein MUC56_01715 [Thermoanaerobaculales bacterium]|nr:hypothetical protein [Thermoanaerobaculales bacterium]